MDITKTKKIIEELVLYGTAIVNRIMAKVRNEIPQNP